MICFAQIARSKPISTFDMFKVFNQFNFQSFANFINKLFFLNL